MKTLNWENKGIIFEPTGQFGWINSHAQVPTVLVKEDYLRIYISVRPKQDLSLTTFIDVDINNFNNVLYIHPEPILELGSEGMFDEHGIMPSSAIEKDGIVYLYYSGWQKGYSLPYTNYTGLAISEDGGRTFEKYSRGPIIDRTPFEVYSATSPCVFIEKSTWHMYYCSGESWVKIGDKNEHTYDIKHAISTDGIKWDQLNEIIIPKKNNFEAITKPTFFKLNNLNHLLYCYRGSEDFRDGKNSYEIGHAFSKNLVNWTRHDGGISINQHGQKWDTMMRAYPCVVKVKDILVMFYNGNSFGKAGFGYSILK